MSGSDADAALAARLQAAEDAALAQALEDERVAAQYDPWKQAEQEWDQVMKTHEEKQGEKTAKKLVETDQAVALRRAQELREQEERDRRVAEEYAKNGTPIKPKQTAK